MCLFISGGRVGAVGGPGAGWARGEEGAVVMAARCGESDAEGMMARGVGTNDQEHKVDGREEGLIQELPRRQQIKGGNSFWGQ